MGDFLNQIDTCGNHLLQLVSRGNAIIAEVLRLSELIPSVFKLDSKQDSCKYSELIADFSYFKYIDSFESKIESNSNLQSKDDELRETYLEILTNFYLAFESIHKYVFDLNKFLKDLEKGIYIQQSLETILFDIDGKQLICEALYLYGVMLLVVDERIEGSVREKMIVSYYRYSAQQTTSDSNIDDVCNLLRSTGYSYANGKKPANYPEDYFKRTAIDSLFLNLIVGKLRSDDIYNQLVSYPYPEHRTIALSNQAAMLFVSLYFTPDILHSQYSNMREIVDKFFSDNFVINIYMGITANLIDAWEPFKAAKQALTITLDNVNLKNTASFHESNLVKLIPQVHQLLKEGSLNDQVVLDKTSKLMNIIRECNVTLRWLVLHTSPNEINRNASKKCKQIRDTIIQYIKFDPLQVFELLLLTSQLELKFKEIYKQLLNKKSIKWEQFKNESLERIVELSEVFSGTKPLTRIEKNTSLQEWFDRIGNQIKNLYQSSESKSSSNINRKIVHLMQVLEEVQDFHQLESNINVKQYLIDAKKYLHCMLKTSSLKEEVLIRLQIIGDLSYARVLINSYTIYMQQGIQKNANLVIKLRATFLKLASALDMPLMRLNQAFSSDLIPVSKYYSSELVAYVRKVLHIIPESLFKLMVRIIELQTNHIQELPTRLMKDQLKQYAKLEERLEIAKLTYSISMFTEGILMMKTTLVGIIQIDPKKLLEDGIRKELVQQVANALHNGLVFNSKLKQSEIVSKLQQISQVMDGFRRSFEYIQDYVCIYGLKIWQEEVSRIVSYNVEQECNAFMREKVLDWESIYQSKTIPIPKFPPLDANSVNFIGRLARELLRITEPKLTIYVYQMRTWYDNKLHTEIVDSKLFKLMLQSIGTAGINGLDRLLSFMIVVELQNIRSCIDNFLLKEKSWQETMKLLNIYSQKCDSETVAIKSPISVRSSKIWTQILDGIMKIGQMQIIRCNISQDLNTNCKFQSRHLASTLETFNSALISEYQSNPDKLLGKVDNPLIYELTNYLEWSGYSDPLSKVYVAPYFVQHSDLIAFALVMLINPKMIYVKNIQGLTCKKVTDPCDGVPFIFGLLTFLKQHREEFTIKFVVSLGQYIYLLLSNYNISNKIIEFPNEVYNYLIVMETMFRLGGLPKKYLTECIPDYVLDQLYNILGK